MYSPKIDEELIPRLYRLRKLKKMPMTRLVNEILRSALSALEERLADAGGPGWLVGTGAILAAEAAPLWTPVDLAGPTPEALIHLTERALSGGEVGVPRPQYLRAPDATPPTRLPGQPRPSRR